MRALAELDNSPFEQYKLWPNDPLQSPPPQQAAPIPDDARVIIATDIHPEETVHQVPALTRLGDRYSVVCAHPEAAKAQRRHLGPDEIMVRRFHTPEAGRLWTPEEIAADALKRYLGKHAHDSSKVIVGPHSNPHKLEFAEVGPVTTQRAVVLAGMVGMTRMMVADTSFYATIPNGLSLEYGRMEDAIDCMAEGGAFDQFAELSEQSLPERYKDFIQDQLQFYKMAEINTLTSDGEPVSHEQQQALRELEQIVVADDFANLPPSVSSELLKPFDIDASAGTILNICWGYRNNSKTVEHLGAYTDPITNQPEPRRFNFAQLATPIGPPEPLGQYGEAAEWLYFSGL